MIANKLRSLLNSDKLFMESSTFILNEFPYCILSEEVVENEVEPPTWSSPTYTFKVKLFLDRRRREEEVEHELKALEPFIDPDLKELFSDFLKTPLFEARSYVFYKVLETEEWYLDYRLLYMAGLSSEEEPNTPEPSGRVTGLGFFVFSGRARAKAYRSLLTKMLEAEHLLE